MTPYEAEEPRPSAWAPVIRAATPLALLLTMLVAACGVSGTGPDQTTLDRDTFIAVYVELRVMALRQGAPGLTDQERQEVLDRHQVTEEQIMGFATVHGGDLSFMREVWDEIETLLDAQRSDSPSGEAR
jgi:hypothetical protein